VFNNIKTAGYLAYKTIARGKKATNALMIFIMSLAFINLVFISSILNGVVVAIDRQLKTNVVSNIVIEPQETPVKKEYISRVQGLRNDLGEMAGVVATSRRYKLSGTVAFDRDHNGEFVRRSAQIVGVDAETESGFSEIASKMVSGRYLQGIGSGDIILGLDLAGGPGASSTIDNLKGVEVGRKVTVIFGNGVTREYTVRGIFKTNFALVDHMAFITSREAESILAIHDMASQILVKLDSAGAEDRYISEIQKLAPNLKIRPWTEYSGMFSGVSSTVNTITTVISAIGLAVAAVTIFILIFVNVTYKRRQIGILKAIGIQERIIVYSYVLQALFYAVSGVIIGTLLVVFALVPYFAAHPLDLPVGAISLALDERRFTANILMLIGAALIAGVLPSWQGARENILKAIWGA
jgi:putative ABC transport system permease protein